MLGRWSVVLELMIPPTKRPGSVVVTRIYWIWGVPGSNLGRAVLSLPTFIALHCTPRLTPNPDTASIQRVGKTISWRFDPWRVSKPRSSDHMRGAGIWDFIYERSVLPLSGAVIVWETESHVIMSRIYKLSLYPYVFVSRPQQTRCFSPT